MAAYFQLSARTDGQLVFQLKTGREQVLLTSPPFASKQAARLGIESVRSNSQRAARYVRMVEKENACYFVIVSEIGRIAGTSEIFPSRAALESGVRLVMIRGATTVIKEAGAMPDAQDNPIRRRALAGGTRT
jgi:uncharacterized protein YegP (UPF0339 family)